MATLTVHADRLLPTEPGVRDIARRLYGAVRALPIISPHGHVDPRMLLEDRPFTDPTSLFIQPDHYVTRLMHAGGVRLDRLGVGDGPLPEDRARAAWRSLCGHWHLLRGTPVRYWFDSELAEIFGVTERPSANNADRLYDQIAEQLAHARFRDHDVRVRAVTAIGTTKTAARTTCLPSSRTAPRPTTSAVSARRTSFDASNSRSGCRDELLTPAPRPGSNR